MDKHQKFLEFNGKNIVFLKVDGTYWIALRPICEALNIDVRRAREKAKNDPILGSVVSKQTLQIPVFRKDIGSVIQPKSMTCLPEKYIYGWIFSLNSDSPELIQYKRSCYELLYNHFHGTITNRKELLLEKNEIRKEINGTKKELEENQEQFVRLKTLEKKLKLVNTKLGKLDVELVKQPELFENLRIQN
tara:strand:- start:2468 stop:3037 length:570 start_codon:yes stop_codon:yes gene_type:complete